MSLTATSKAHLSISSPGPAPEPESTSIDSINDLIVNRATTFPFKPLLAYPRKEGNFVYYTAKELDSFADEAAKHYVQLGLIPRVCNYPKVKWTCPMMEKYVPDFYYSMSRANPK